MQSSEIGGGVSCLDMSDLSQKSPSAIEKRVHSNGPAGQVDFLNKNSLTQFSQRETFTEDGHSHLLHEYRQTRAFQTLLRRQATAVRKI